MGHGTMAVLRFSGETILFTTHYLLTFSALSVSSVVKRFLPFTLTGSREASSLNEEPSTKNEERFFLPVFSLFPFAFSPQPFAPVLRTKHQEPGTVFVFQPHSQFMIYHSLYHIWLTTFLSPLCNFK